MKSVKILDATGVILAGGASRRFGSDKAFALLDDKPLIEHVAGTVSNVFENCLLITNTPERYNHMGFPHVRDIFLNAGPLGGIHAALSSINTNGAFIVGCDMPFVREEIVRFLLSFPKQWDAVVPWLDKGPEPLCAFYQRDALAVIEEYLRQGGRKIQTVFQTLRVRKVREEELLTVVSDLSAFHNVNFRSDLKGMRNSAARFR